jgi:sterol desaturase/sphingolipid hydroxylase (fatty acid hydroxylase superfamily)
LDLSSGWGYFADRLGKLLFTWDSIFSLSSLLCALCVSALFLILRRYEKGRRIRPRTILWALFPNSILKSRSNWADIGYLYFYVFAFGLLLGWAILSYQFLTNGIIDLLVAAFGQRGRTELPEWLVRSIITLMLFLAYELGYWVNHYLSHRVAFLWEFHKVHHSATVLTPLTVFRVHPVYMWIFLNILAAAAAIASGLANYLFGNTAYQYAISDTNILLVVFIHAWGHLQHSQVWISFTGLAGRIFLSPAHHQVHHSTEPVHFNKNLGSVLAVWDWMFGTLYVPKQEREVASFGVEPNRPHAHTIQGELLAPFYHAALRLMSALVHRPAQALRAIAPRRTMPVAVEPGHEEQLALPRAN